MLGYESWQRKRLRRVERRETLERMAQRVRDFRSLVAKDPQDRRAAGDRFLDGYSRDEKIWVALSQEPLFFAANQLGLKLPEDCCVTSNDPNGRTLTQSEAWTLKREIRKQRWKRVLNWPSLVLPAASAIVIGGCYERRSPDEDGPSSITEVSDSQWSPKRLVGR